MSAGIERLLAIMSRLRDPTGGCPWDREQTWRSISPHTLEEAYELADAIERDDPGAVRDELGDLLFQVVFQAQIAREQGLFDFDDVAAGIGDKLERRHPHVFGDQRIASSQEQSRAWEAHKAAERRERGDGTGVLDGVARALPALARAAKLGRRAAAVGFDWSSADAVLDKVDEEVAESRHALGQGNPAELREELGDLLFAVAQAARYCGVDPEEALRQANDKFERRFRHIEADLDSRGLSPQQVGIDELEALWIEAKQSGR
ncbi:MAG TPA: nucleoside triphosphate pyrophosphohydrolase [Steroidobacteraceae bacterium]|nr:nucleoside triphosphate pyrophosphohydrolase [Steroidobacteraceae bacterium]